MDCKHEKLVIEDLPLSKERSLAVVRCSKSECRQVVTVIDTNPITAIYGASLQGIDGQLDAIHVSLKSLNNLLEQKMIPAVSRA